VPHSLITLDIKGFIGYVAIFIGSSSNRIDEEPIFSTTKKDAINASSKKLIL